MPHKFHSGPAHAHFLTFSCCGRRQFLTDHRVCGWLVESIEPARRRRAFALRAYVIMPDHVPMLLHPNHDRYSMSKILRDIKEPVARRFVRHGKQAAPRRLHSIKSHRGKREVYRMWQAGGGFDRNLSDGDVIGRAIAFIEWNPVRRGYTQKPGRCVWSSARSRAGVADVPYHVDVLDVMTVSK